MSVEIFSRQQFEQALPEGHWSYSGLVNNEHTYLIRITDDIFITIRSSVDGSDWSADTGEDSIRAWLVDKNGSPLGSKVSKWTNREPGWDKRLLKVLRTLWGWAEWAGYCPDCKIPMCIYKSKQPKSKNKVFKKCCNCQQHFQWLED